MAKAKNAFRAMMTEAQDERYDKKMSIQYAQFKEDSKRDKEQDKKMRVKQK